jgi:XTP/dITP diphosphohydrolase
MEKIILASNNQGKIAEFNALLKGIYQVCSMQEMAVNEVPETGLSFVENAIIKARNASKQSALPALADDSGLVVDVLGGAPGIYSARYAGEQADSQANLQKLLDKMIDVPDENRLARFWCAIAYVKEASDPTPLIVQCAWEGLILKTKQGNAGFGYDPIFYVPTHGCTAAELNPKVKNKISHRGQALQAMLCLLNKRSTID